MILTNKFNLPEIIVRSIGESWPPAIGRVAVTALIDSPLIRYLKIKHWDQLTEDASDRLWALLGMAAHTVVQRGRPHDAKAEQYMKMPVNGMDVTGRSDLIIGNELIDLKVTSVYSFLLGEKESWVKQLNVYNYMAYFYGMKVEHAKIYGILRDWSEMKQYGNDDYPPIPFFEQEIELWTLEWARQYIEARVLCHQYADTLLILPLADESNITKTENWNQIKCTDADRWLRPTTYAVMKGKNVKATRVLDSFSEANQWMIDNGKTDKEFHVVERPGQAVRCERFCICKPVCPMMNK
jgi:hypothetical protein